MEVTLGSQSVPHPDLPKGAVDGRNTLKKYRDFLSLIDGSLAEHAFLVGWNPPDFMNGPEEDFPT